MDSTPHTHTPKLSQSGYPDEWRLVYGDSHVKVCPSTYSIFHLARCFQARYPSQEEINKALLKVVKKHDQGSIEAGLASQREREVFALLQPFTEGGQKWGSDILTGGQRETL